MVILFLTASGIPVWVMIVLTGAVGTMYTTLVSERKIRPLGAKRFLSATRKSGR